MMLYTNHPDPKVQELFAYINAENRMGRYVRVTNFQAGQENLTSWLLMNQVLFEGVPTSRSKHSWVERSRDNPKERGSYNRFVKSRRSGKPYTTEHHSYYLRHTHWFTPKSQFGENRKKDLRTIWGFNSSISLNNQSQHRVGLKGGTYVDYPYPPEYYLWYRGNLVPSPTGEFQGDVDYWVEEIPKPSSELSERPTLSVPHCPDDGQAILALIDKLEPARVDALTEIAELKNTVTGLQANLLSSYGWFHDFLRKSKLLSAGIIIRRSVETDGLVPIYTGSKASYNRLLRKYNRKKNRLDAKLRKKYQTQDASSVTDRLASHWLNAQYGVGPIIYTLEGIREQLIQLSLNRHTKRARAKISHKLVPELPIGWTARTQSSADLYYWGFVSYNLDSLLSQIRRRTKVNPILTAWELVPLSFVIDWFTNIGSILSSFDFNDVVADSAIQKVEKWHVNEYWTKETEAGTLHYTCEGYVYRRSNARWDDKSLALFQLSLPGNWQNWVSGFSLAWSKLRQIKLPKGIYHG